MPYMLRLFDSANPVDNSLIENVRIFHDRSEDVSFFQHINLFNFIDGNKDYRAILLLVEDNANVMATLMALQIKQGPTWFSFLNKRFLITGYPVISKKADSMEILSLVVGQINRLSAKETVFVEFRPHIPNHFLQRVLIENKYKQSDHLNLLVDLNDHEVLWKHLHESKRRQVRKSQKNGLVVGLCVDENELMFFFMIIKNLYKKRIKKPYPSYSFFLNFYRELQLKNKGVIFLAKWKGRILGGMLCPYVPGQTIYEWYIAGLDKENVKNGVYPSVLLTWSAIEYGRKQGFKTFDFMGAGKPGIPYGVRDFKKRFGGELINAGRYIYVNKPIIYKALGLYFRLRNNF